MRVELHRVSHDVSHLVISPVVHAFHRMHDTSLHGFETVLYMWDGAVENGIAGVVEEPVLVHAAKVMNRRSVESVNWFVV